MISFVAIVFINMTPQTEDIAQITISNNNLTNLEQGKQLYQQYCASCHGTNLKGQANWRNKTLMVASLHYHMMKQGIHGTIVIECCLNM